MIKRYSEKLLFEIFDQTLYLSIDSDKSKDIVANVQSQATGMMLNLFDHYINSSKILASSKGAELIWEAQFSTLFIEKSCLSANLKQYRDIKDVAVTKDMLVFPDESSLTESIKQCMNKLIRKSKDQDESNNLLSLMFQGLVAKMFNDISIYLNSKSQPGDDQKLVYLNSCLEFNNTDEKEQDDLMTNA
jgi:hypothetical protein